MDTKGFTEAVLTGLKRACDETSRAKVARKMGIEYQTLSAVLRRGSGELETFERISKWLSENGYLEPHTAQEAPTPYHFQDATKMVIAADLHATADVIASNLPTHIKTDKLHSLHNHLPEYIHALEDQSNGKKKRAAT